MNDLTRESAFNHESEPQDSSSRWLVRYSWLFSLIALVLVLVGLFGLER